MYYNITDWELITPECTTILGTNYPWMYYNITVIFFYWFCLTQFSYFLSGLWYKTVFHDHVIFVDKYIDLQKMDKHFFCQNINRYFHSVCESVFITFKTISKSWNCKSIYIYIYTLLVCLFVSNKHQNGWTDRAQILGWTSHDPMEGCLDFKKVIPIFFLIFVKFWKLWIRNFFLEKRR